jgi:O-antigen/teichoic acid export membrane protein
MARNMGWVAGSRGFNSVISILYLATAARALGPEGFGAFALILTYGQMVANFVQFQSWKGVIRYGALHITANRPDRLERLFGFTATLDFASAILGALIAVASVPLVALLLHWTPGEELSAAVFGAVLLLTTGATPSGMLRLFDRFDLAAYAEAVGPMVRLIGSVIAWMVGASFLSFLVIWAAAAVAQAATQWVAAVLINRSRLAFGRRAFRQALAENDRLLRFMLQTNISNSVSMFWTQLGTLAVGAVAGPAEAGAFRLSNRLSKGMVRPVQPITLALYPELSRLVAEDDHAQLRKVVLRITAIAAILALCVVLATGLAGRQILHLLVGAKFEFAHRFLFLLSIATALDLAGFAFEPLQNAHGKSWTVLRSKIVAACAYALLLVILLPRLGGTGAAVAAIICSLLVFGQLAFQTARLLRNRRASAETAIPLQMPISGE